MFYWDPSLFNRRMADKLVYRKLSQLIAAKNAVADIDLFEKSILHAWCQPQLTGQPQVKLNRLLRLF